jgi:NarL family two-component system response regulator LiaR
MMPAPIRVLIVDDHAIVRKGIQALMAEVEDIEVVGEAADGGQALSQAQALQPDVILMDLVMPHMDGVAAISEISSLQTHIRVIALTSFATDDKIFPAIKAGALGYILKDSDPEDLIRSIRQVHRGELSLSPEIARKVLEEVNKPVKRPLAPDPLTSREMEVLGLVAQGLGNQEIATRLIIEDVTVRTHVSHILRKLQLSNRVQAALYALREGITSLDDSRTDIGDRENQR